MQEFIIIGCGSFGASVARSLYSKGADVMVIDKDAEKIQEIADSVTHAVEADAMDEVTLKSLGIRNFDVAVVSMGSDIQSSILITLLVKELGVKKVVAKAKSDVHAKVLYKIGADRVIFPERDMGIKLAHSLVSRNILDYIDLDPNYSIVEINTMKEWENKALKDLQLPTEYGVNVLALKRGGDINISPNAEDMVLRGDIIIGIASVGSINKLGEED